MENVDARLTALEVAISDLRALVAQLENRLTDERTRIRTMRQTVQCPSCGGRRILHVRALNYVLDSGVLPLALHTRVSAWTGAKHSAPLEAYVCRTCGLLECNATGLDALAPDGKEIVELASDETAPPQATPYR